MPREANIQQDQWLNIDDFSPGIFSHTNVSQPNSNKLIAAPLGAADAAGTYSCMCLPGGGLGPLPKVTAVYDWTESLGDNTYIVGLLVHNELADGTTEAFVVVEYDDGVNHYFDVYSYIPETTTFTLITSTTGASAPGFFGSPYPQFTRVQIIAEFASVALTGGNAVAVSPTGWAGVSEGDYVYVLSGTGSLVETTLVLSVSGNNLTMNNPAVTSGTATIGVSNIDLPGTPVIVFPGGGPASGATGQVYLYPDPSNPTAYGVMELNYGQTIAGQILVHQNRIIDLAGIDYSYPAGGGMATNEQINYTDPPNSPALGFQQTVLGAEEPYGYGCGGSISAGELFIVKKRGGGIVVTGDIFAPNVTILPGVQPTGGYYGNASSGKSGFFYCSFDAGAWVWNGGNTSTKVSQQLDDLFFFVPDEVNFACNNLGWYVQCINDKVYFSNNYIYDTRSNSWWKYYPDETQGGTSLFWVQPVEGRNIFAAPLSFGALSPSTQDHFLFQIDQETVTDNYQWTSMPLRLSPEDRLADIREIVIRASCPAANNASLTLYVLDKGNVVWGPEDMSGIVDDGPDIIRFNVDALGVTEPQIRVVADTTGSDNVVIHSINVKYRARAHQAVTN